MGDPEWDGVAMKVRHKCTQEVMEVVERTRGSSVEFFIGPTVLPNFMMGPYVAWRWDECEFVPDETWVDVTLDCTWHPDTERGWGRIEHNGVSVLATPEHYRLVKCEIEERNPVATIYHRGWAFRVERKVKAYL